MTPAYAPGFRSAKWRLRLFATVLAVVGQTAILGAALGLARDESSAVSHTEQGGVDLHHGHNEATCVACIALSFQSTLGHAVPLIASGVLIHSDPAWRATELLSSSRVLPNSCRAPPREA